jgi:hypothetical protein
VRKNLIKLICLWVALLFIGFVLVSYYRQQQFERQVEENVSKLEEAAKENSVTLEGDWEALDKDDPEELSDYFWEETSSLYFTYFLDLNKYLQNEEKLFSGTFRTQARESALLEVHSKIYGAYSQVGGKWVCGADARISAHAGEYCKILLEYYGDENSDPWDDFVGSDQYEAFLKEVFSSVENIEELLLDESYQNIIDHAKKTASRNIYSRILSESYIFLAETAYGNYQTHKSQEDFAGAIMHAEIIYVLNDNLHALDRAGVSQEILYPNIKTNFVYIHDIISDALVMCAFPTLIVVAIYLVQMKKSAGLH